jgi:hypothetical protein
VLDEGIQNTGEIKRNCRETQASSGERNMAKKDTDQHKDHDSSSGSAQHEGHEMHKGHNAFAIPLAAGVRMGTTYSFLLPWALY